jgi:predicted PurR-regulated permease PerM
MKFHTPQRQTTRTSARGEGTTRLTFEPGQLYRELRQAIFLVAALYLLYRLAGPISTILLFFLLVFILATVLNPIVTKLHSWRIPRMLGSLLVVSVLLGAVCGLGWMALPPLLGEFSNVSQRVKNLEAWGIGRYESLIQQFPALADQLPPPYEIFNNMTPEWGSVLQHLGVYTLSIASGILTILVFIVLLIYTLGKPEPLVAGLLSATPASHRKRVEAAVRRCMEQLKRWAFGSVIVGLIVGIVTGVGLHLLGVPYAFLFGAIAAAGELIPTIGPILSSVPPILIALTIDPNLAVWVAVLFLVLQQLESNLLTPMILGESLELHPVSLIFTMVVMHSLYGLLGALLAVPVCAIIKVCWTEFYLKPQHTDTEAMQERADEIITEQASAYEEADAELKKDEGTHEMDAKEIKSATSS